MKRLRSRQHTRSRILLFVVGVLLATIGVIGLLLSSDTVDRVTQWADSADPILNADLDRSIADNRVVYQLVALALALVCIAVGLLWLKSQIPPRRHHQDNVFPNDTDQVDGRNVVAGGALASAIEADLEQHPAVEDARVEFRSDDRLIRITLTANDVIPTADLARTVIAPATERAIRVGELPGDVDVLTDVRLVAESRQIA